MPLRVGNSVLLRYPETGNPAYMAGVHRGTVDKVDANGIAWIDFERNLDSLDISADGRAYVSTDPTYSDVAIDVRVVSHPPVNCERWLSKKGATSRRGAQLPQLEPGQLVMLVYPDTGSDAYIPYRYYGLVEEIDDRGSRQDRRL